MSTRPLNILYLDPFHGGSHAAVADGLARHSAFTNLTSALAADAVWFNSEFHRRSFLEAVPELLRALPDHAPGDVAARIESRSRVLWPGIDVEDGLAGATRTAAAPEPPGARPPLILWNHRWEHDKNPDACFDALEEVKRRGGRFRLAVAGRGFRRSPPVFGSLRTRFREELEHLGHLDGPDYRRLLARAHIVISTAGHEFFGLAVLEAIAAGAYPLLPDRLSYPEIIPAAFHDAHLYGGGRELIERLLELLERRPFPAPSRLRRETVERFGWARRATAFDAALDGLAGGERS